MLVLGRRVGERILVGKDVVVTILSVRGQQVRVGIDAPRNVAVLRGELSAHPAATALPDAVVSGGANGTPPG
jgi:carbon storage regulator